MSATEPKTKLPGDQKKQYTIPATEEVCTFVKKITNRYSRAVVATHETDDEVMDAGLSDCALFTAALGALDERLDSREPKKVVEFIDRFKKKRGPQSNRESHDDGNSQDLAAEAQPVTLPRKRAVSALGNNTSRRKGFGSS
jgi:hypothetical protein